MEKSQTGTVTGGSKLENYGEKHMTIPEAKRTARTIEWRQRRDPTFFASKVGAV